jgi:hypothetical protein
MLTVNESGLYTLGFTSRKPEAKAFMRWVTSEVLPSIRKTGSYSVAPKDRILAMLESMAEVRRAELELEQRQLEVERNVQAVEQVAIEANAKADESLEISRTTEERMNNRSGYFTALGYARKNHLNIPLHKLAALGKRITAACNDRGTPLYPVHDPRFGTVNTYPIKVLEQFHDSFVSLGQPD